MKKFIRDYGVITIGVILITASLEFFFYPNNIASGGVSGLALILESLFGISPGVTLTVLNVLLFALAFWLIGGSFGVKSIYASFGLSAVIWLYERFYNPIAVTNNLLLATVFGSVISALGLALVFNKNSSTGGTSIIAKILNKYLHIDIGESLLMSDFVVTILAIYAFGVELGLYGLISVYLTGTLVDKFIDGFNLCKSVVIISDKCEEIGEYIIKKLERSFTYLHGSRGYSKLDTKLIYTIISRKQFIMLRNHIKEIDSKAFIAVTDAREVLGEGFADLDEE